MSERNTRCPVLGCGRWSNRCSGRPRPLPPDFSLQLDSSIDAVVNSHVCAACYVRHTRRLARGPEHTPSSYAAPHGPPRCAGHGGYRPSTRVVLSTFFPSSPSPSLLTSCSFVLDVLSHPAAVHLPSSPLPPLPHLLPSRSPQSTGRCRRRLCTTSTQPALRAPPPPPPTMPITSSAVRAPASSPAITHSHSTRHARAMRAAAMR